MTEANPAIPSGSTASTFTKYQGTKGGLISERKLYYDEHMLLVVETGLAAERYRRIAWVDICGLTITNGATWLVVGLLSGLPFAILLLISLINGFDSPGVWISGALCGTILGINLARGQSVKCVITSAYSKIPIKSITRMRKAIAFQRFVEQRVSIAQGLLTTEEINTREESRKTPGQKAPNTAPPPVPTTPDLPVTETATATANPAYAEPPQIPQPEPVTPPLPAFPEATAEPASMPRPVAPPSIPMAQGLRKSHRLFPFTLALFCVSSFLNFLVPSYPALITLILFGISLVVSIIALVQKLSGPAGHGLNSAAQYSMTYHIIAAIVGYMGSMIAVIHRDGYVQTGPMDNPAMHLFSVSDSPVMRVMFVANGCICAILTFYAYAKLRAAQARKPTT